jgi:regulator of RNase E activity RraA
MAARIRKLGAKGVLVDGRVRDLDTVGAQGIPVCTSPPPLEWTGTDETWCLGEFSQDIFFFR